MGKIQHFGGRIRCPLCSDLTYKGNRCLSSKPVIARFEAPVRASDDRLQRRQLTQGFSNTLREPTLPRRRIGPALVRLGLMRRRGGVGGPLCRARAAVLPPEKHDFASH